MHKPLLQRRLFHLVCLSVHVHPSHPRPSQSLTFANIFKHLSPFVQICSNICPHSHIFLQIQLAPPDPSHLAMAICSSRKPCCIFAKNLLHLCLKNYLKKANLSILTMCPCFASKLVSDRLVFLSVLISGSVG